jgi:hypothetical protein
MSYQYHWRQRAPVENVSSTSGMYIKRYFFKETQTIFPGFDEYNVLNYQFFLLVLSY